MTEFRRFAVYDLGPAPLARWGAAWLGRDVVAGQDVDPLGPAGWTRTPRRYGFHATIKAVAEYCQPDGNQEWEEHQPDYHQGIAVFHSTINTEELPVTRRYKRIANYQDCSMV